jgi:hypothetical protein
MAGTSIADPQSFGRFFTTAKQRSHLDELRRAKPEVIKEFAVEELVLEESAEIEAEVVPMDALTVKGVVYRSDRKNTAWLNDSNTNAGDLGLGPVKIDEKGIKSNRVDIEISDNETKIILKVGETYDPHSSNITDITAKTARAAKALLEDRTEASRNNERRE